MNLAETYDKLINDPSFFVLDSDHPQSGKMIKFLDQNPNDVAGFIARWGQITERQCKELGLDYTPFSNQIQVPC